MHLVIHATNVTGLGATQVVRSTLEALDRDTSGLSKITCYVPENGPISGFSSKSGQIETVRFKRILPKAISRVMECLFPSAYFELGDVLLVLGDVPLRTKVPQVVFVQQANLFKTSANPYASRSLVFRIMRLLTGLNSGYASRVVVQTSAMRSGLTQSYANWAKRNCINIIGQPPPSWFAVNKVTNQAAPTENRGLRLFYPAAGYPNKNHRIFQKLADVGGEYKDIASVVITLDEGEFVCRNAPWLTYVGRLSGEACIREYSCADALLFPSVLESYGLPLVEAMTMGLPILAADLPYARVLCGELAIYFDPESGESLHEAITVLKQKLDSGWRPDWEPRLRELPADWTEVAQYFLKQIDQAQRHSQYDRQSS